MLLQFALTSESSICQIDSTRSICYANLLHVGKPQLHLELSTHTWRLSGNNLLSVAVYCLKLYLLQTVSSTTTWCLIANMALLFYPGATKRLNQTKKQQTKSLLLHHHSRILNLGSHLYARTSRSLCHGK